MHYPIYSSKQGRDNVGLRNALQPLFEKYKVDLVLQGHDHTYGRGTNLPLGNNKKTIGFANEKFKLISKSQNN